MWKYIEHPSFSKDAREKYENVLLSHINSYEIDVETTEIISFEISIEIQDMFPEITPSSISSFRDYHDILFFDKILLPIIREHIGIGNEDKIKKDYMRKVFENMEIHTSTERINGNPINHRRIEVKPNSFNFLTFNDKEDRLWECIGGYTYNNANYNYSKIKQVIVTFIRISGY